MFEVDDIEKDSTIIELLALRQDLNPESIENLKEHISYTYAEFIKDPLVKIKINGKAVSSVFFNEDWAYPPDYCPKNILLELTIEDRPISIWIEAGLIGENASAGSEYGVYFYCNDRLIARGIRTYEVGYTRGKAGNDHPALFIS